MYKQTFKLNGDTPHSSRRKIQKRVIRRRNHTFEKYDGIFQTP
ncbi:hypothetical protein PBCV1_a297aL [Paramecium bursaria Chlorella virus 1]|uniref:Uncharacterized protein n=1 Tax=Paramecium bursaria Chlorella virus 1 TaxID=10506 RepID=F8TU14_PBCV1|nr:hypothetical protein PBCV1_a297aL [Paramecium bursaria Chlorella virus 1]AEI70075.1 hypothetical protein [Paramecium bursaria Chlorella virus 1]